MPPTSYAGIRDQLPLAMATTSNPLLQGRHAARDAATGLCKRGDSVRSERSVRSSSPPCDVRSFIVDERKLNICMTKLVVKGLCH